MQRVWSTVVRALVASLALLLPGCQEFCSCALISPVNLSVVDALDGGIVHSAIVNGFPFDCPAHCPVRLADGGVPHAAGSVDVVVSAPGYATRSQIVDVPEREAEGLLRDTLHAADGRCGSGAAVSEVRAGARR